MEAMDYEYLLMEIYNCSRGGANGDANADVYRKMDYAIREYELQKEAIAKKQMPISTKSVDTLKYDMQVEIARITSIVQSALQAQLKKTYNEDQRKELDGFITELAGRNRSKELLDDVIQKTLMLLKDN